MSNGSQVKVYTVQCTVFLDTAVGKHTQELPCLGLGGPGVECAMSRTRRTRCGVCQECVREECGECAGCRDKIKYGGEGRRHQACSKKRCDQKYIKNEKDDRQPCIDTIFSTSHITLHQDSAGNTRHSEQQGRCIRRSRCDMCVNKTSSAMLGIRICQFCLT